MQRRSVDDMGDITTVIGPGSKIVGSLSGKGNYAISGSVEGDCNLDGSVLLQEQGEWKGVLSARVVVIAGQIDGQIAATEKLELTRSARVRGDVKSPVIAIAEGAVLDGKITMEGADITRFEEKRDDHPPKATVTTS